MTQRFYEMEDEYYGRLHDRWDAAHEEREEAETGYKRRARALDELLDNMNILQDALGKLSRGNDEERQVGREYERLSGILSRYRELMEEDFAEAERLSR